MLTSDYECAKGKAPACAKYKHKWGLNMVKVFHSFSVVFIHFSLLFCASHTAAVTAASGDTTATDIEKFVGVDVCVDCHEDKYNALLPSKHGQMADARTPFAEKGCETCHGAGEKHSFSEGEERGTMLVFGHKSGVAPEQQNASCLKCHQDTRRMHWQGSAHESADLSCASCHMIHQPDGVLLRARESEVCVTCHMKQRAEIYRASSHPIREGKLTCTDCHNPHGSDGPKSLIALTINQNCYECHAEKRGPFLWEHEPVTDDCNICHTPHGSNQPALLVRRAPHLCQQCHMSNSSEGGKSHISRYWDFSLTETGGTTGQGPSRFILGMSCMNCHSQVHGSNHPSGRALQR